MSVKVTVGLSVFLVSMVSDNDVRFDGRVVIVTGAGGGEFHNYYVYSKRR